VGGILEAGGKAITNDKPMLIELNEWIGAAKV